MALLNNQMVYLPTQLGDVGKCWCAYSSTIGTMEHIWDGKNIGHHVFSQIEIRYQSSKCRNRYLRLGFHMTS